MVGSELSLLQTVTFCPLGNLWSSGKAPLCGKDSSFREAKRLDTCQH